jgi:hypothetical protein
MTDVINHRILCRFGNESPDDDQRDEPPPVEGEFPEDIPIIITVAKTEVSTTNHYRYGECSDLSSHVLNPWGLIGHSVYGLLYNAVFPNVLEGGVLEDEVFLKQETRCNLLEVKVMVR